MTHDEIKKLLPAYCIGEISQAERAWVEEHLSSCRSCRADVADLKTALRLIRNTPEVEPPPWMTSRIMSGILDQSEPSQGLLQRLFFPLQIKLPLAVMAIALVCLSGYYFTFNNHIEPESGVPQPQQSTPAASQAEPQTQAERNPETSVTASDPAKPAPSSRKDFEQSKSKVSPAQESLNRETVAPAADKHNKDLLSAPKTGKGAKRTKKQAAESDAITPLGNPAEIQANDSPAPTAVRLQTKDASAAEDAIRQAVYNSGGMITGTHGSHKLKARIPAVNSRELLNQLQRLGKIIDPPVITESTENVDLDISW